jgi:hypothetical protein
MTTNELHELARNPFDFDTKLAQLHADRARHQGKVSKLADELHRLCGDRKAYRGARDLSWGLSLRECEDTLRHRMALHGDGSAYTALSSLASERAMVEAYTAVIGAMDAVYGRQGNRWTRFFPSVTKSQPHIHRTLTCRTLYPTTVMTWAPALSGKTDEQAVAELDEALCSVCFPDAPVALHNYQSKRSQAEQYERQVAKAERDAAKAAKQLTEAERFRTSYRRDLVTTVAACKEVIRDLVAEQVALEGYSTPEYAATWTGDADQLARLISNVAANVVKMEADARIAARVLEARELDHPGWGMTAEAISQMMVRKEKSARKEWGL